MHITLSIVHTYTHELNWSSLESENESQPALQYQQQQKQQQKQQQHTRQHVHIVHASNNSARDSETENRRKGEMFKRNLKPVPLRNQSKI